MQRAGGISGGSLCRICCLRKRDQRTPHPNCLMWALISNDKLKPGESVSSFYKQLGEQGLLCVYNISHLFLASSIWLVRSLEPRLKHVLSKCYPDLPKLWIACSYTYPKETELMVHENVMLAFYARVQIIMYPHLLQHFFLDMESVKYTLSSFDPKNIWWSYFLAEGAPVPFPVILHLGFYLHSSRIKSQFPVLCTKTNKKTQPSFPQSWEASSELLQGNKCQGTQNHQLPSIPAPSKLENKFVGENLLMELQRLLANSAFCNDSLFCECN